MEAKRLRSLALVNSGELSRFAQASPSNDGPLSPRLDPVPVLVLQNLQQSERSSRNGRFTLQFTSDCWWKVVRVGVGGLFLVLLFCPKSLSKGDQRNHLPPLFGLEGSGLKGSSVQPQAFVQPRLDPLPILILVKGEGGGLSVYF